MTMRNAESIRTSNPNVDEENRISVSLHVMLLERSQLSNMVFIVLTEEQLQRSSLAPSFQQDLLTCRQIKLNVQDVDGASVGVAVGIQLGIAVGGTEGFPEGDIVGIALGCIVGVVVGTTVGSFDGVTVGMPEGTEVGIAVGI